MCGIVGTTGDGDVRRFLLRGLETLEYRGYDSAGIASTHNEEIRRIAVAGRVGKLRRQIGNTIGTTAIGHTRWATHGAPTENNAHPIVSGTVAVVHNGIIENHATLRTQLCAAGRTFHTDTDTEVIAHLLDIALAKGADLLSAIQQTATQLTGAFAIAAITAKQNTIAFARRGSPLMIGSGEHGMYIASDAAALENAAARVIYLEDGDCGILSAAEVNIVDVNGQQVQRAWNPLPSGVSVASLGEYRHFMQKEIFEQPYAVAAAAKPYIDNNQILLRRFGNGAAAAFRRAKSVLIIGCGSSYHAGLTAQYWLRELGIPCRVEIGSEYRYCTDTQAQTSLTVAVSQSGETADTLSAFRIAKASGATTLAMVNSPASSLAREADFVLNAGVGAEIGVASTKCFTAQLVQLLALTLAMAKSRRLLSPQQETAAVLQLRVLPDKMRRALMLEKDIRRWARMFAPVQSALFIGRHMHYPLALEGALKLKEISYLHAEGCAAGELKHGMLALIDDTIPVVGLAPDNALSVKMESNLAEVAARNGHLFVLGKTATNAESLPIEDGGNWISPMVYAVPLQLLAYHTALEKGTDIDKPRNLAKSVTVE